VLKRSLIFRKENTLSRETKSGGKAEIVVGCALFFVLSIVGTVAFLFQIKVYGVWPLLACTVSALVFYFVGIRTHKKN